MTRQQVTLGAASGFFTAGCAAIWQSFNPTLPAATALFAATLGSLLAGAGASVLLVLFIAARKEAKRSEAAKVARDAAIERLVELLNRGMELWHSPIASDADLEAWSSQVLEWRQALVVTITNSVGFGTAQSLEHVTAVSAASYSRAFNKSHNSGLLYHMERMNRLRVLIAQLEAGSPA